VFVICRWCERLYSSCCLFGFFVCFCFLLVNLPGFHYLRSLDFLRNIFNFCASQSHKKKRDSFLAIFGHGSKERLLVPRSRSISEEDSLRLDIDIVAHLVRELVNWGEGGDLVLGERKEEFVAAL
jgi:hypothetical protein